MEANAPLCGGAAEDNVEERDNSEVKVTGYVLRTDMLRTDVRTYGRTYAQRDLKVEILF